MTSTKDVLDHRLKCFGEGDLEGILADYSPDAVLFMPAGLIKGVDAITPVFQHILSSLQSPALSSPCTSSASKVTTPTFAGMQKRQITCTTLGPIRL
jgi:hypothetical protein